MLTRLLLVLTTGVASFEPLAGGRPRRLEASPQGKFEAMLDRATFADDVIIRVGDPRLATILRGIRSARHDDKARRAFELLYADVPPVRLAGELVFRRIEKLAHAASSSSGDEALVPLTAVCDAADVLAAREVFRAVDTDGKETLNRDELLRSGLLLSLGEWASCESGDGDVYASVDRFIREVDEDADGRITFVEFMLGATRALYTPRHWDDIASALRPATAEAERFEAMVDEFRVWSRRRAAYLQDYREHHSPTAPSRLDIVLDGCFAGLDNRHLLAALRVVFEDYDSLRLIADLIFRLMRATAQRQPWYEGRLSTNLTHCEAL